MTILLLASIHTALFIQKSLWRDFQNCKHDLRKLGIRQHVLQGQVGPSESVPPLWYPSPQEITMNTYIPTHWHSKAPSSTSGAKIQFHAVCQLLSLLAKEKLLPMLLVRCVFCVHSSLWSVSKWNLSCGKLAHNNFWGKALICDWPLGWTLWCFSE